MRTLIFFLSLLFSQNLQSVDGEVSRVETETEIVYIGSLAKMHHCISYDKAKKTFSARPRPSYFNGQTVTVFLIGDTLKSMYEDLSNLYFDQQD